MIEDLSSQEALLLTNTSYSVEFTTEDYPEGTGLVCDIVSEILLVNITN